MRIAGRRLNVFVAEDLSISDSFHIGVWGGVDGPTFGRLVFFNDEEEKRATQRTKSLEEHVSGERATY